MASAKADHRSSSGAKRARTDGDWTCPQCGNMNFAFRTTCNIQKCGASRPSQATSRLGASLVPGVYDHGAAPPYMGTAGALKYPLGIPTNYGASMSVPLSAMPYDYSASAAASLPYSFLSMQSTYGPAGSVFGGGLGFGTTPLMDGYGIGLPGPVTSGPWSGNFSHENASRKRRGGPGGLSEGDWICPKCENINFAFRTTCNIKKCGTSKPSVSAARQTTSFNQSNSEGAPPDGSWTCNKCGNVNYPFRTKCNRKNCGAEKSVNEKETMKSPSDK